jgi:hypothetical protein
MAGRERPPFELPPPGAGRAGGAIIGGADGR